MCTVSFYAAANRFIFTFNRDEQPNRQTPDYLSEKDVGQKKIYFPKDSTAGGSWFTADSKGNAAMLFNGAFESHVKVPPYKKSRGLILMELISADSPIDHFKKDNLSGIEPFSVILFDNDLLYRLAWDGNKKISVPLDTNQPHIFSSATLYPIEIQKEREKWFTQFLAENEHIDENTLYNFHRSSHANDKENGLIIEREQGACTLSISQIVLEKSSLQVNHWDIITGNHYKKTIAHN